MWVVWCCFDFDFDLDGLEVEGSKCPHGLWIISCRKNCQRIDDLFCIVVGSGNWHMAVLYCYLMAFVAQLLGLVDCRLGLSYVLKSRIAIYIWICYTNCKWNKLRIANCELRIANCELRIANCELRIADCCKELLSTMNYVNSWQLSIAIRLRYIVYCARILVCVDVSCNGIVVGGNA